MKILVAACIPSDSRYANATNIIKTADGFAGLGHEVTVVCRRAAHGEKTEEELREEYGLSPNVSFMQLPSSRWGFPLNKHGAFARQVLEVCDDIEPDFSYCRNYITPVELARRGIPVVAESHAHPGNTGKPLMAMISGLADLPEFRGLVTISPVLKDNFEHLGVPEEKMVVLPDAVDVDLFKRPDDFERSSIPRPMIVYAGHLYDYKGIPDILSAAEMMPEMNFKLVGGHEEDVERVSGIIRSKNLNNVSLTGHLPHSDVPIHLWDADVLLLPPSGKHPSAKWTSPVKLGEYLATKTPVVATAIPALEYWLTGNHVRFVEPDSPESLAEGILAVLEDRKLARSLAEKAYEFSKKLSYIERCRGMLAFTSGWHPNDQRA